MQSLIVWLVDHPSDTSAILITVFNGLLVYFIARLVTSTNKLWQAGERQLTVAQQSADAALLSAQVSKNAVRAVLVLKNFTGSRNAPDGFAVEGYAWRPNITNVGNSHASCTFNASFSLTIAGEHVEPFDPPKNNANRAIVGPGMTMSCVPVGISIGDAMRVWRREAICLYYCRVDYQDIFNEPHHVECCVEVNFRSDPSTYTPNIDPEFIIYAPRGPQNTVS